jgi:FlaG/FlaF family flagellin (archaellin)
MIQRFSADERGVSEVVGAILVFALAIMLLTIMQTQAVPNQNSEVEFQHSLDVQSDLIQFHQIASSVAADGSDRSVAFNLGTGYPSRLLFFNPPRVRGQLETTSPAQVEIRNVEANDGEVDDYIGQSSPLNLDTRRLEYTVEYNEIRNDPTTRYEYGVLYSEYDGGTVFENTGNLIDGTRINLLYLAGETTKVGTTEDSIDVQGVSAPARSVSITGDPSSGPLEIRLPTQLTVTEWEELYPPATTQNLQGLRTGGPDSIVLELDPSKTYDLRMSRIGLETGAGTQTPHYIVPVDPGVTSAGVGQTASIEYEVRDKFNNPVSGAEVDVPTASGGTTTKKTNDQGRVSTAVTTSQTTTFTAELQNCPGTGDPCNADYRVQVPGLNLNPSSGVRLTKATTEDPSPNTRAEEQPGQAAPLPVTCDNDAGPDCKADVTFENTNAKEVGMKTIRINHYNPDPQDHNPVEIDDETEDGSGGSQVTVTIGGTSKSATDLDRIRAKGSPDNEETYTFDFSAPVHEGDYFVLTIIYDNNERALYFVSPTIP